MNGPIGPRFVAGKRLISRSGDDTSTGAVTRLVITSGNWLGAFEPDWSILEWSLIRPITQIVVYNETPSPLNLMTPVVHPHRKHITNSSDSCFDVLFGVVGDLQCMLNILNDDRDAANCQSKWH